MAKYTSSGTLSWSKTWGGASNDSAGTIIKTSDGGYAMSGRTRSYGAGDYDAFLAKYTSDGTLSWNKTLGGISYEDAYGLTQASDGGYAITGEMDSFGAINCGAYIAKYDSLGNLSWIKTWGGGECEYAAAIIQTSDGGYAITGETDSFGAGYLDTFFAKYTSDGTLSWSKTWGSSDDDESGIAIAQTSDNGYSIAGYTYSYGAGDADAFLAKFKADGTMQNCSSPMCQSVSPTVSSPSPSVSSPSASVASPAASMSSPSPTIATPGPTSTTVVSP
jgi:hypothetical protein